jgi:hypothetical protein
MNTQIKHNSIERFDALSSAELERRGPKAVHMNNDALMMPAQHLRVNTIEKAH